MRLCRLALLAAAGLAAAQAPASAATRAGTCNPAQAKYFTSDVEGWTTAKKSFAAIANAAVTFTQGGNHKGCVIVRFSAITYAHNDRILIQAMLDEKIQGAPAAVQYSGEDGGSANAHAFDFIFADVEPGTHQIQMQAASQNGNEVVVNQYSIVVQYSP